AFASGIRDLILWLDLGPTTIVGHSLGGGVAMQFAYQFPERTQRLALVSSGGLGRGVHGFLRAATLPGAGRVLPRLGGRPGRPAGARARPGKPVRAVRARATLPAPRRARALRPDARGLDRHDRAGALRRRALPDRGPAPGEPHPMIFERKRSLYRDGSVPAEHG